MSSRRSDTFKIPQQRMQLSSIRPGITPPEKHRNAAIFTAQVMKDFTPKPSQKGMLAVKKNLDVFCIGEVIRGTILVSLGDRKKEGFVPVSFLNKGTPLADVKLLHTAPDFRAISGLPVKDTENTLYNTINGLCMEVDTNSQSLAVLGCATRSLRKLQMAGPEVRDLIYLSKSTHRFAFVYGLD